MRQVVKIFVLIFFLSVNLSCSEKEEKPKKSRFKNVEVTKKESPAVELSRPEIIRTFPHDIEAFTQGLLVHNGIIYESTGQRGESRLMKVNLLNGNLIEETHLAGKYFGEGIAEHNGNIYYLTWTS